MKSINKVNVDCFEMNINKLLNDNKSIQIKSLGCFKSFDISPMLYEISEKLIENNIDFINFVNNHKKEFSKIINKYKI